MMKIALDKMKGSNRVLPIPDLAMALFLPLLVVHGIYSGLVSSIGAVTSTACGVVKNIYTHKNPDVTRMIKKLDLERRLVLVHAILNTISKEQPLEEPIIPVGLLEGEEKKETLVNHQVEVEQPSRTKEMIDLMNGEITDPIQLCLIFLRQTVQDIHDDLIKLNAKVTRHNAKWFNSWRTLSIQELLDSLSTHSQQLDDRFNDLTKVSSFLTNRRIASYGS
jgi:hypothetical protein